jgi:hypothetical protein
VIAQAPPPVVAFGRLPPGWHSFGSVGRAYATSWRYHPRGEGRVLYQMPRGGIVVAVTFSSAMTRFRPLKLVLPKKATTLVRGTSDTHEYRLRGRAHGRNVEILVDIRQWRPTRQQLRLAQQVLNSVWIS